MHPTNSSMIFYNVWLHNVYCPKSAAKESNQQGHLANQLYEIKADHYHNGYRMAGFLCHPVAIKPSLNVPAGANSMIWCKQCNKMSALTLSWQRNEGLDIATELEMLKTSIISNWGWDQGWRAHGCISDWKSCENVINGVGHVRHCSFT